MEIRVAQRAYTPWLSARSSAEGLGDCGSARAVDEWLQGRHELSIVIFLQDTPWHRSPCLPRLNAPQTAISGGIEHYAATVHHPATAISEDGSPSIHRCGGRARRPGSARD